MKIKTGKIVFGLILLLSVWGTLKTCFLGFDTDESYNVTLIIRLLKGDCLFKEMWEIHQTSAMLMAPFAYFFRLITGGYEGIVLFFRIVGILIQFVISMGLYKAFSIRKYDAAALAIFIFYNYTPKFIQVPEYSFLLYLFMGGFIIAIVEYLKYKKRIALIILGLCLAGVVFSYPLTVLVMPVIFLLLYFIFKFSAEYPLENHPIVPAYKCVGNNTESYSPFKALLVVILTEGMLGGLFVVFIFLHLSLAELISNMGFILSDGSHSATIMDRIRELAYSLIDNYKLIIPLTLFTEILRRFWIKRDENKKLGILFGVYILAGMAVPMVQVLKVYRNWGFIYLYSSFWILIMLVVLTYLYFVLCFTKFCKPGRVDKVGLIPLILEIIFVLIFIASHLGSNLDLHVNAGLLLPAVVMLMLEISTFISKTEYINMEKSNEGCGIGNHIIEGNTPLDSNDNANIDSIDSINADQINNACSFNAARSIKLLFVFLLLIFLLLRCICVRVMGPEVYTIGDSFVFINEGALKGSWAPEKIAEDYKDKLSLYKEYVTKEDKFMYIGSDRYLYCSGEADIAVPSTISSPTYNEQTVKYYELYPEKIPSVIFAENQVLEERIDSESFKSWLYDNYTKRVDGDIRIYIH